MISQSCPKCLSKRIRRGYRPTPFWLKMIFRYKLLCDICNWEFVGFAVPGTVTAKPTGRRKTDHKADGEVDNSIIASIDTSKRKGVKKRVKVRL